MWHQGMNQMNGDSGVESTVARMTNLLFDHIQNDQVIGFFLVCAYTVSK